MKLKIKGAFLNKIIAIVLTPILSFFSVLSFGFNACAESVYTIDMLNGKYKTQGRTFIDGGVLMLDWSASGMIFTADCEGDVNVTFNATYLSTLNATPDATGAYFTVIIDGTVQSEYMRIPKNNNVADWISNNTNYPFHITQKGDTTFKIAENLPKGDHTFEIYRQTEAVYATFGIKEISLNGTVNTAPQSNNLYIEFIGDSITAGYGMLAGTDGDQAWPLYQDSTRGWAYKTARALNADYSILARSGIAATTGLGTASASMSEIYEMQRYFQEYNADETNFISYNFDRKADVVVLGLGTNDFWTYSNKGMTTDDIKLGFQTMLQLIRENNPNAKVVWIHGMMTKAGDDLINEVVLEAGGYRNGYYTLSLPLEPSGKHPRLAIQSTYSEILANYINNIVLNEDYNGLKTTEYEHGKITIYRATDASKVTQEVMDGDIAVNNSLAYNSDATTTWKFAVSSDIAATFKSTSANFAAPVATPISGGGLTLSWTPPDGASGKTTLKIIGDNYFKEIQVAGNSITLNDIPLGGLYRAQITKGNVSSKILNYSHIYAPTITTNASKNQSTSIATASFDTKYINLDNYIDLIGNNAGIMFKIESDDLANVDYNITKYIDDSDSRTKAFLDNAYENIPIKSNSDKLGISVMTTLKLPTVNNGVLGNDNTSINNTSATRTAKYFSTQGNKVATSVDATVITTDAGWKGQMLSDGFVFIPFDVISETGISAIRNVGFLPIVLQRYRYYAKHELNTNGNWVWKYLNWEHTDYETESTGEIKTIFDRSLNYTDCYFIADYDKFVDSCINTSDLTDINLSALSSSTDYLPNIYLNTINKNVLDEDSGLAEYTLTDSNVQSSYFIDNQKTTDWAPTSIKLTTALGEVMKLGFTAPKSGLYEISAPITASSANNIYYSVIKQTTTGAVSILQQEKLYTDDTKYFSLMNVNLAVGETVYLTVKSEVAGATVDLGVPQFTFIEKNKDQGVIKYSANEYFGIEDRLDLGFASSWEFGSFINPYTVGGTQYNALYYVTYDAAVSDGVTVINHDLLGVKDVVVGSNPIDLLAALKPFEMVYYYTARSERIYQIKESQLRAVLNNDSTQRSLLSSAPLRNYEKIFGTTVANVTTTDIKISYGLSQPYAGNHANKVYLNLGHYQRFTAPSAGDIKLTLGDYENPGKIIILKNDTVTNVYNGGTIASTNIIDIGTVNAFDTVTIIYSTVDDPANSLSLDSAAAISGININPVVSFTPASSTEYSVNFAGEVSKMLPEKHLAESIITLPSSTKKGAYFVGWNDGTALYNSGAKYTIEKDVTFTPKYAYYGDLNDTGEEITVHDVALLHKVILEKTNIGDIDYGTVVADIDMNKKINLVDCLRQKKMYYGVDVTVGAQ